MKNFYNADFENKNTKFIYKDTLEENTESDDQGEISRHDKVSSVVGQAGKVFRAPSYLARKTLGAVESTLVRVPVLGRSLKLIPSLGKKISTAAFKGAETVSTAGLEMGSQAITRSGEIVWDTGKAALNVIGRKNQKTGEHIGVGGAITGLGKSAVLSDSILTDGEKHDLSISKTKGKIEGEVNSAASEKRKEEWGNVKNGESDGDNE